MMMETGRISLEMAILCGRKIINVPFRCCYMRDMFNVLHGIVAQGKANSVSKTSRGQVCVAGLCRGFLNE